MRRVLAVAFGLSLLAGAFTAAPALGATYHLEGVCTYGGDPFYMQFFYLDKFDLTKVEVRDYVAYMKTDCRTRKGSLTYTIS